MTTDATFDRTRALAAVDEIFQRNQREYSVASVERIVRRAKLDDATSVRRCYMANTNEDALVKLGLTRTAPHQLALLLAYHGISHKVGTEIIHRNRRPEERVASPHAVEPTSEDWSAAATWLASRR